MLPSILTVLAVPFAPRVKMKSLNSFSFRDFLRWWTLLVLVFRVRCVAERRAISAMPEVDDMVCVSDSPLWKGKELLCNRSFVVFDKGQILRCTSINRSKRQSFSDVAIDGQFVEAEIFTSRSDSIDYHNSNPRATDGSGSVCKIACWPMASARKRSKQSDTTRIHSKQNKFSTAKATGDQNAKDDIWYVKFTDSSNTRLKRAAQDGVIKEESSVRWERPMVVLKFISCLTLTILVSFSVIVYFYSGMFYQECLAHLCSEVSLVAAHICILAHTTDSVKLDKKLCSLTALLLQYFFQVSFLSLTLEAFFLLRIFLGCSPSYKTPVKVTGKKSLYRTLLAGPLSLLFLAWGFPAIIAAVSAYFFFDEYVTGNENCWYNAKSSSFSAVVGPVGIFASLHVLFIAPLFIYCDVPERVKNEHFFRARSGLNTRWASIIVMLLSLVSWITGLLSEDDNLRNTSMFVTFCIFTIFLGSFIPVIRIATEEQVRKRIWLRFVPGQASRVPWPITSFDMFDDQVYYYDLNDEPRRMLTAASRRSLPGTAASVHSLKDFTNKPTIQPDRTKAPPAAPSRNKGSPVHRRI